MSYSPDIAIAFACALALASALVLWAVPTAFFAFARIVEERFKRPTPPAPADRPPTSPESELGLFDRPRVQHAPAP